MQFQSLAHHLVDIFPKKLHHEDEQADEEGARKEQAKTLQDENVKFLDSEHA